MSARLRSVVSTEVWPTLSWETALNCSILLKDFKKQTKRHIYINLCHFYLVCGASCQLVGSDLVLNESEGDEVAHRVQNRVETGFVCQSRTLRLLIRGFG